MRKRGLAGEMEEGSERDRRDRREDGKKMGEKMGEKIGEKMREERCEGERETAQVSLSVVIDSRPLAFREGSFRVFY